MIPLILTLVFRKARKEYNPNFVIGDMIEVSHWATDLFSGNLIFECKSISAN